VIDDGYQLVVKELQHGKSTGDLMNAKTGAFFDTVSASFVERKLPNLVNVASLK